MDPDSCSKIKHVPPIIKDENGNNVNEFDSIPAFYQNSIVFITGVTGFLGHVLLCKLLSSCPGIQKIYILMREKRNRTINERFQQLFNEPVFDKVISDKPDCIKKVIPIRGDCLEPNMGLSKDDCALLQAEVSVIFHVAATVKFDAPLKTAVKINVRSTRDLLDMTKCMKQLKAFVHVSTAFAFCAERKLIEEELYEPPLPASRLISVVDQLEDGVVDRITPALLQNYPNTYVYTKAVSEGLFSSKSSDLPIAIFRPAIVISTAREPLPGWINNMYGPTGVWTNAGLGIMRTLHADKGCKANIVPCDYVINALVASAWYTARRWRLMQSGMIFADEGIPIFNYGSTETSKFLTWEQFLRENEIVDAEFPFYKSLWAYSFTLNKHKCVDRIYTFFLHLVPAYIVDTVNAMCGKKSNLLAVYGKIHKLANVLSYFCTREWIMPNKRVKNMWIMLSEEDKRNFDFNLETINWKEYFRHHVIGIRQYILKDTPDTIPKAIQKRKKLILIHYTVVITTLCCFFLFLNAFCSYLF